MPPTAFIAYSHADHAEARDLKEALARRGVDAFVAHLDVPPGAPWDATILTAHEAASTTIVLLSALSLPSPHVGTEVARAIAWKHRMVPVPLDAAGADWKRWPSGLSSFQATTGGMADVADQVDRAIGPVNPPVPDQVARSIASPGGHPAVTDLATSSSGSPDPTASVFALNSSQLTELAVRVGIDRNHLDTGTAAKMAADLLGLADRAKLVAELRKKGWLR